MQVAFSVVMALAMILFGAELFTNSVEWLGRKLHLGQGAIGSVLAALGTALPETAVPVTAILLGGGDAAARDVGIGGILGAPFLLTTLGCAIMAIALLVTRRRHTRTQLFVQRRSFQRDMTFFLIAFSITMVTGIIHSPSLHRIAPFLLVALYLAFVTVTLRDKTVETGVEQLHPLYLQWRSFEPQLLLVLLQLLLALVAIVGGAHLLSGAVEHIAKQFQIPPFVLSALLIPLATELPETLNSVVWIRQGKDALALGNITGAMVFQSTLVPALGVALTPWDLNPEALITGGLTLAAAGLVFGMFRLKGAIVPGMLLAASMLYWVLPLQAITLRYHRNDLFWVGGAIIITLFVWMIRRGFQLRSA